MGPPPPSNCGSHSVGLFNGNYPPPSRNQTIERFQGCRCKRPRQKSDPTLPLLTQGNPSLKQPFLWTILYGGATALRFPKRRKATLPGLTNRSPRR